jgi:hypothetical protein
MRNISRLCAAFVAALAVSGAAIAAPQAKHGGLWFNPDESGWGVAVDQQGDTIFAVLLTYGITGQPTWFQMPNMTPTLNLFAQEKDVRQGGIYRARSNAPTVDGTIFSSDVDVSFLGGSGLIFDTQDASQSAFWYDIEGALSYKKIAPLVFGESTDTCDTAEAPNYQGLWWNAPAGSEPGWGLYLAHQSDTILAVSLGYDGAGNAAWYAMELAKAADGSYSGAVTKSTGPSYDSTFDASLVTRAEVGFATLEFSDGANGVFTATIEGVDQPTKDITRYVFAQDDTGCH